MFACSESCEGDRCYLPVNPPFPLFPPPTEKAQTPGKGSQTQTVPIPLSVLIYCTYIPSHRIREQYSCHCFLFHFSISIVELGTEFRSEKIPRNRLGMVSVIPRKKVLIPTSEAFRVPRKSQFRSSERNSAKILSFTELARPLWSLWPPLHSTKK
jgi:hypothetical protein